jgi:23S rRNA (pseudouridine1915-N3)-methyltransferase
MRLWLVWIGKTKDRRLAELIDEYLNRLSRYARYDIQELKEAKSSDAESIIETEARSILSAVAPDAFKIALDERGRQFSSHALAEMIEQWQVKSIREVAFIIGGHLGLSDRVKQQANMIWSLSALTFTHDMARLLLIEQLYRAYSIIHGHPYQK